MRVVCTICTDQIKDNLCAAPCGHTFHYQCLSQWLLHGKNCPQCRERCLERNIIRLYVNTPSDTSMVESSLLDPQELQEKLSLQKDLMAHKDKALAEARESLDAIQEEMLAWQAQHRDTHRKLVNEQASNAVLKRELKEAEENRQEVKKLRSRVGTLEGVEKVLRGSKEDVDELVAAHRNSSSTLAMLVVALKRDYKVLKEKKDGLVRDKNKLGEEATLLKRKLVSKEKEVSALETALHLAEEEKEALRKKVEMLQAAVDSPGSRYALKRMLESPMPEQLAKQQQQQQMSETVDIGASPLLTIRPDSSNSHGHVVEARPGKVAVKRPRPAFAGRDNIIMPISKVSKAGRSEKPFSRHKELKFAPRKNSGSQLASKGIKQYF